MIGEEYVAVFLLDVFFSFDLDFNQEKPKCALGPELGQVIGDEVCVAKKAGYDDAGCYKDGDGYKDGECDAERVEIV